MGDGQFEHIEWAMVGIRININTTCRDEHVPAIEWYILTVKERVQAIANELHLEKYLHRLFVKMVYNVICWLNSFPHKHGIHDTMSLMTIVTGSRIDHKISGESSAQMFNTRTRWQLTAATYSINCTQAYWKHISYILFPQYKLWERCRME